MVAPSPARAECERHEQQKLTAPASADDELGYAVARSGTVVAAGARFSDTAGPSSGSVHVFRDDGGGFAFQQELVAADAVVGELAGWSVAVDGAVLVMGAPFDQQAGSASGSAYVFRDDGRSWSQEAKLTASDAAPDSRFGNAVGVSGDVVIVGSYSDDDAGPLSGSAYVYRYDGASWAQEAKLAPPDLAGGDQFGISVAVSGDAAVVGSYIHQVSGVATGAAYVYRSDAGAWVLQQTLAASDGAAHDWFGYAVAIDGDAVIVGAPHDSFGTHLLHGSAYVFSYDGGSQTWSRRSKLNAADATEGDEFGTAVSVSGGVFVVGAPRNAIVGSESGSAYVFTDEGGGAVQTARLTAQDAAAGDRLGFAVAAGGDLACAGAYLDQHPDGEGSVYLFEVAGPCVNACPADITGDGAVDTLDLLALLAAWGACPGCPADIDGNGMADVGDLLVMLGAWGICP